MRARSSAVFAKRHLGSPKRRGGSEELTELAWLYNVNRDIFMTPGREEEWTLSVALTEADADAFVAAFEELAAGLTA
jgi:glutamate-1-semialdehyde aminotransferase